MTLFPDNPNINDIFSTAGKSWQWNGVAWLAYSTGSGGGVTDYNDLTNKPTLGTAAATDATAYATAAQGTDSRTPTAHKSSHATGGTDALTPADIGAATAAQGTKADSALQAGTAIANISGLQTALDGKQASGSYAPASDISPSAITGTAVVTSDPRLSDSRSPLSHKSSHATGGADALSPADIGAAASSHTHPLSQLEQSAAANGQVPVWDATTSAWVPQTPASGGVTSYNQLTDKPTLGTAAATDATSYAASGHTHTLSQIQQSGATNDQVPVWNQTTSAWVPQTVSLGSGSPAIVQVFNGSGSWTKPAGAKKIEIQLVGGGGGGGSGRKGATSTARSGGGGGGGGGVTFFQVDASTLPGAPATVSVVIGAGGLGGTSQATNSTNGNIGADGGDTTFGIFRARGGFGGTQGNATTATGGAGGPAQFTGGTGGTGGGSANGTNAAGAAFVSGGGGGGGTNASNTNVNGTNGGAISSTTLNGSGSGTSPTPHGLITTLGQGGGGGAASQVGNAVNGPAGGLYGGGGGGGGAATDGVGNSGAGGVGANGMAIITTYF